MAKIGYVRCSTDEERQNVERQLMGVGLDKKFIEYQSGKNEKNRPVFQEMLSSLKPKDTLLFQELSRAGRNSLELQITLRDLVEKGIRVEFVSEGLIFGDDTADPMKVALSKIILTNIASFNELFLTQTSIAVKQGQKRALKEGKLIGGSSPKHRETFQRNKLLGKHKQRTTSPEVVSRNESVVAEVKKIISYSSDTLNYSQIAEKLTEVGVTTAKGLHYSKASVCRLIKKFEIPYVQKNRKQSVTA